MPLPPDTRKRTQEKIITFSKIPYTFAHETYTRSLPRHLNTLGYDCMRHARNHLHPYRSCSGRHRQLADSKHSNRSIRKHAHLGHLAARGLEEPGQSGFRHITFRRSHDSQQLRHAPCTVDFYRLRGRGEKSDSDFVIYSGLKHYGAATLGCCRQWLLYWNPCDYRERLQLRIRPSHRRTNPIGDRHLPRNRQPSGTAGHPACAAPNCDSKLCPQSISLTGCRRTVSSDWLNLNHHTYLHRHYFNDRIGQWICRFATYPFDRTHLAGRGSSFWRHHTSRPKLALCRHDFPNRAMCHTLRLHNV